MASSTPRWMMEADWEENEDAGYGNYDNDEEDFIYYENPCDVCEGGSYITLINIDIENYYNDGHYEDEDEDYDEEDVYQDDTNDF
jgi:hypothetical protein